MIEPNLKDLTITLPSDNSWPSLLTGQKGIGFKSVFRVTDRPEIHSNGYHICFDVKSGPTGYILPDWIVSPQADSQIADK